MFRRFGLVYSLFSLLVLVVLAILVLGRLNTARTANLQEAQASFARLTGDLADAARNQASLETLRSELRAYSELVPSVEAVVLYDPDRGLQYVWALADDIVSFGDSELGGFRGFPAYSVSDVSQIMLRGDIGGQADLSLYVDGVYRVLTLEDAYRPLRDSLIALLAFAFLTVVILLIIGTTQRTEGGAPVRESRSPAPKAAEADRSESAAPGQTTPPRNNVEQVPTPETFAPEEEVAAPVENLSVEEVPIEGGEPGTLVNPLTGLSYRQHLSRRLGLELERSAYNDQDLSLLLIRFSGLGGDEAYIGAAAAILATFQYEDLCFEYDPASFCVILPNTDLPQGIKQAEAFRRSHPEAVVGLSARNGRLVEATRVLTEADRSLTHAANEVGGVVGFRPDPRKYRQYVTQKMSEQD